MLVRIDTHLGEVVITLEPHSGVKQTPTGGKYVWRLDPQEAVRVGNGLLKAAAIIEAPKPFTDAAKYADKPPLEETGT